MSLMMRERLMFQILYRRTNNSLKMGLMVTFSPNFISEGKMRDEAVADQI
ncbi:hypothetical protein YC2023_057421 [Brassica napus]